MATADDGTAPLCADAVPGGVTFTWAGTDGVPMPRCAVVRADDAVRVRNTGATPVSLSLGAGRWTLRTGSDLVLTPKQLHLLVGGEGTHRLRFTDAAAAELRVVAAAPPGLPVLSRGCADRSYRPTYVALTCADGRMRAEQLTWSTWTPTQATARGVVRLNDGRTSRRYPARLTFRRVQGSTFTEVHVQYERGGPAGRRAEVRRL